MDCNSAHNKMIFYLDDELPESEKEALEEHLSECSSCHDLLEKIKPVYQKSMEVPPISDDFTDRTIDKLFSGKTVKLQTQQFIRFTQRVAAIILFMVISITTLFILNQKETNKYAESPQEEEIFINYYFADLDQNNLYNYYTTQNKSEK